MFDGDTLNIKMLLNKTFADACEKVYSPRNAFCISRNDGKMNPKINIFKDTVINLNALQNLYKKNYTKDQIENIKQVIENDIE